MAEHDIDRLFREQLGNREFPYEPERWDEVAAELFGKRRRRLWLWWWLGGLVAAGICVWWGWSLLRLSANDASTQAVGALPIPVPTAPTSPSTPSDKELLSATAAGHLPPAPRRAHGAPPRRYHAPALTQSSPRAIPAAPPAEKEGAQAEAHTTRSARRLAALPLLQHLLRPTPTLQDQARRSALGRRFLRWHLIGEGGWTRQGLRIQAGIERQGRLAGKWRWTTGALVRYEPLHLYPAWRTLPAYSFGVSVKQYRLTIENQLSTVLFVGAGRQWGRHSLYAGLGALVPLAQQRRLDERSWEWAPPAGGWHTVQRGWSRTPWQAIGLVQAQYGYALTPWIQVGLRGQGAVHGDPGQAPNGLWLGVRLRLPSSLRVQNSDQ